MKSETVYHGRIIDVRRDVIAAEGGASYVREVVVHPGAVAIIPIIRLETVLLIHQYRYAIDKEIIEVPAGTLRPEETPESCARRELEEETGFRARTIEPLGKIYTSPGVLSEVIHLFVASGLEKSKQSLESDEALTLFEVPLTEAVEMARRGEIQDAKTICAILIAQEHLKTGP